MQSENQVDKVTSHDLHVGLICADRDGNRIRIDRVDRPAGRIAYHFLNDELRCRKERRNLPSKASCRKAGPLPRPAGYRF